MMTAKRILVTGSTGFLGRRLTILLAENGYLVRALVRDRHDWQDTDNIEFIEVPDIASSENWDDIVRGCYAVVHLAARVHRMTDSDSDPQAAYTSVNTTATARIATAAAEAGVGRFIFLSSIKSYGDYEKEGDLPVDDPYALSKAVAEKKLQKIAANSDIEYVIIRPPLVYGPGVKANFRKLIAIIEKGLPLPLGSVRNKRSFIGLGNLTDFIMLVLEHPAAANRTYNVSDDDDLSTPDLIRRIAAKLGRKAILFPFPVIILGLLCRISGQRKTCERLTGSLQVDCSAAKKELGWHPKNSFDQELEETIKSYLDTKRANG